MFTSVALSQEHVYLKMLSALFYSVAARLNSVCVALLSKSDTWVLASICDSGVKFAYRHRVTQLNDTHTIITVKVIHSISRHEEPAVGLNVNNKGLEAPIKFHTFIHFEDTLVCISTIFPTKCKHPVIPPHSFLFNHRPT